MWSHVSSCAWSRVWSNFGHGCGHWTWSKVMGVVKHVVTYFVIGALEGYGQGCALIFVMAVAKGRVKRVW